MPVCPVCWSQSGVNEGELAGRSYHVGLLLYLFFHFVGLVWLILSLLSWWTGFLTSTFDVALPLAIVALYLEIPLTILFHMIFGCAPAALSHADGAL